MGVGTYIKRLHKIFLKTNKYLSNIFTPTKVWKSVVLLCKAHGNFSSKLDVTLLYNRIYNLVSTPSLFLFFVLITCNFKGWCGIWSSDKVFYSFSLFVLSRYIFIWHNSWKFTAFWELHISIILKLHYMIIITTHAVRGSSK